LSLHEAEKRQILAALAAAKYNKTMAAAALGLSRRTLHRKLREWNGES
ncbi:MAG: helix-turn-helix domain-containing protein, partial [Kiritimatiellae bacterium]|nr:helix-turn-helix domain-containing protein [Kiritimatiellia bacterium]